MKKTTRNFDVIVCGGGPAGVCGAISAAREGASVLLLEQHNCIGGIWTSGLLSWLLDVNNKGGILKEIMEDMQSRGAGQFARSGNFICEPEVLKYALEQMCQKAGVTIRLHTHITGVNQEAGRIKSVITHSKSGREEFFGKIFIDTTGDGDLGHYAGCTYHMGQEETNRIQPMSLIALISGVEHEKVKDFDNKREYVGESPKQKFKKELGKANFVPSYTDPGIFHLFDDVFIIMANHQYGYKGTDAEDLTEATIKARQEINAMVQALKNLGEPWGNLKLLISAQQIGVREGRRIKGLYTMTKEDLIEGKRHEDVICQANFGIDVHSLTGEQGEAYSFSGHVKKGYDIPLRALIAYDLDNLLLGGRCISGDFYAHASYRVTGNAAITGQAAGVAAAMAVKQNILPKELDAKMVQEKL